MKRLVVVLVLALALAALGVDVEAVDKASVRTGSRHRTGPPSNAKHPTTASHMEMARTTATHTRKKAAAESHGTRPIAGSPEMSSASPRLHNGKATSESREREVRAAHLFEETKPAIVSMSSPSSTGKRHVATSSTVPEAKAGEPIVASKRDADDVVDPVVNEMRLQQNDWKEKEFEEEKKATEALRVRMQSFPHYPLLGRPFVEHLTGKRPEPEKPETGTRSIVLSPSYGPTSGGVWVQVVGAGSFHTPNSLQCKLDLVEQFCYSNHYFYAWCYITPKCAGVYPFHCHNGPLQYEGKYAVVAKVPWVTSVYPFSGDTSGGTPVTVRGWNFEPHCPQHLLCRFGEQVVPAKYYTSSSIMCIAPCNTEKGFVSVEVSNDGGVHWSMSGVQYGYVGDPVDLANGECQRYIAADYHNKPRH